MSISFGGDGTPRELEEAQRASEHALKLDPNSAEAHVSVGQALAIQRRYVEAAIAFDRAIEEDPTLFEAYYLYGRVLFESGDSEKSVKLFEKAQAVRPDDFESRFCGMALTELGRRDEARHADQLAVESIEKYLELNPDEARAYSLGANSAYEIRRNDRSNRWSQQAMNSRQMIPWSYTMPHVIWHCSAKVNALSTDSNVRSKQVLLWETGLNTTRISRVSAVTHASKRL